jgi:hypothetical protein
MKAVEISATSIEGTRADVDKSVQDGPVGLGGWLVFLLIDLASRPIVGLLVIPEMLDVAGHVTAAHGYSLAWKVLLLIHFLVFVFLLPSVMIYAIIFRKFFFRYLLICFLLLRIISSGLLVFLRSEAIGLRGDLFYLAFSGEEMDEFYRSVVHAAIWLPYACFSKRVQNTFASRKQIEARLTRTFS